ncbi:MULTISPECIES: ScbR family autoregulator-binding transcription factor [unclassified Streptomyces]|uniref:ScbR family autoregulator-binding transcription factor n=1 Tax=unclassified Streptomyces TaxID=2593676 RepID=UPI00382F2C80
MLKQERAVRTLRSLIDSAADVFRRHGYVQARLADISAGAGVSAGALHFHFESKAALASTVQSTAAVSLRAAAHAATLRPDTDALQRLINASHALADTLRRDVVARAGVQLNGDPACENEWDMCQEWRQYVQRLLAQAADEHLLTEGATLHDAAASIVAATTGMELLARNDAEWLSPETLTRFWEVVLPSLATPAALTTLDLAGAHTGGRGTARGTQRPLDRTAFSSHPLLTG